jgi:hypothetical protein
MWHKNMLEVSQAVIGCLVANAPPQAPPQARRCAPPAVRSLSDHTGMWAWRNQRACTAATGALNPCSKEGQLPTVPRCGRESSCNGLPHPGRKPDPSLPAPRARHAQACTSTWPSSSKP